MRPNHYPDIWLRITGTPIIALLVRNFTTTASFPEVFTDSSFYLDLCWSILMVVAVWETNRVIIKLLDRRYSWIKQTFERIVIQASLVFAVSAIELIAITYIHHILLFGYSQNFHLISLAALNIPVITGFVLLLNSIYTAMYLVRYHQYTVNSLKLQLEETIRVAEKLKLDKLYNEHSELSPSYYQKHLIVNYENSSVPIQAEEVAYIFVSHGRCRIKLFSGKDYASSSSLENLELLLDPAIFFRINPQLLANMNAIKQCRQDVNGKLNIDLFPPFGESVFVSKRKASEFREWLSKKI